jgi:hypothetical protein
MSWATVGCSCVRSKIDIPDYVGRVSVIAYSCCVENVMPFRFLLLLGPAGLEH